MRIAKPKTYAIGGVTGLFLGLLSAYLFARASEESENGPQKSENVGYYAPSVALLALVVRSRIWVPAARSSMIRSSQRIGFSSTSSFSAFFQVAALGAFQRFFDSPVFAVVCVTLAGPAPPQLELGPRQTVENPALQNLRPYSLDLEVEEWKIQPHAQFGARNGCQHHRRIFPWPYVEHQPDSMTGPILTASCATRIIRACP
jgi:hypothetical protein